MKTNGPLVHILLVTVLLHISLGEQCPGNATAIADGYCNEENNNPDCSYDGGDCCQCTCLDYREYACGYQGFDCRDPTSPNVFSDCEGVPVVSAPCATDVIVELEVWDTSSAEALVEKVSCSGGTFEVTWRGYVEIEEGIYISNGTILNITGSGPEATMDGRGSTRLFTVEGATLFLNNMILFDGSAEAGGAIAAEESSLYLENTSFVSNMAVGDGGAIYVVSHTAVSLSGPASFVDNTAGSRGGALYVENGSSVSRPGNFLNPETAIRLTRESVDSDGSLGSQGEREMVFYDNQALSGGAIFVFENSNVSWDASTVFYGNRAHSSGGAIFISSGSSVSWFANTSFIENKADGDGGAIYMTYGYHERGSPFLLVKGSTAFLENHCNGSGGGLAVATESTISLEADDILFKGNSARAAGGAVFISGLSTGPQFRATRFLLNRANIGGAASLTSSGTTVRGDKNVHLTSSATTFDQCWFEGNEASSDGGAIHTWTGLCIINGTDFVKNYADRGGAIYFASMGYLRDCNFIENVSSEEGGYAVYPSGGFVPDISRSYFFHNVPLCNPGRYRYTENYTSTNEWRGCKRSSCGGCSGCDSCDGIYWCYAGLCDIYDWCDCDGCDAFCNDCLHHGFSYCRDQPEHTRVSYVRNLTLEDLDIEPGYWRSNNRDQEISRCYNPEACPGGRTGAEGYECKEGYNGLGTSTGTVVIVVGGFLAVVALSALTFGMISRNDISANPDGRLPETTATWRRPLQSLKIIIVAWQILTQFAYAADVVYPGIYGDLLKGLDFFNFDLSLILSTGCVVDLSFGKRLIMSTVGPIAFVGFLATTCAFGMTRHRGSESALATVRRNHLSVFVLLTLLMYSPISSILLKIFVEDDLNGECVLRADRRLFCDSTELLKLQELAVPMIVLYTLGIPVFYGLVLFRNRKVLMDKTAREADLLARSTSALWRLYRPECYYFELIECLRRVFFAAILTFVYPNSVSQVTIGLMVGFFFMILSEILAPYASRLDAWLSRMGHTVVCTSMIWAILRKFEDAWNCLAQEDMKSKHMFTWILLAFHGLMVAAVLVETGVVIYQLMREEKVKESSTPRVRRRSGIAPHSASLRVLDDATYFAGGRKPPI